MVAYGSEACDVESSVEGAFELEGVGWSSTSSRPRLTPTAAASPEPGPELDPDPEPELDPDKSLFFVFVALESNFPRASLHLRSVSQSSFMTALTYVANRASTITRTNATTQHQYLPASLQCSDRRTRMGGRMVCLCLRLRTRFGWKGIY